MGEDREEDERCTLHSLDRPVYDAQFSYCFIEASVPFSARSLLIVRFDFMLLIVEQRCVVVDCYS